MPQSDQVVRRDMLRGMLDALDGRGTQSVPKAWPGLYRQVASAADPSLRSVPVRLATIFGDQQAINRLAKRFSTILFRTNPPRSSAGLLQVSDGASIEMLHGLTAGVRHYKMKRFGPLPFETMHQLPMSC
ncbi:MAG: hypothetical protein CM1200mP2_54060 [Planctomycetaceae bacterium]|nr:MAG: hypothetical protein CM1200mP2_54060 [Planctomycetaceae bacterium]